MTTTECTLLEKLIEHVELLRDLAKKQAAQTRNSIEQNSFNRGRVDAAEAILTFYESLKSGDR